MTRMEECPHCGAAVRRGRLACPECGSDARTGWLDADEIDYRSVELPDGWPPQDGRRSRVARVVPWLVGVALALVAAVVLALIS